MFAQMHLNESDGHPDKHPWYVYTIIYIGVIILAFGILLIPVYFWR